MKQAKNIDSVEHTWCGQAIAAGATYIIQAQEALAWANDPSVLGDIGAGKLQIGNGDIWIEAISDQISFLQDGLPRQVQTQFERTDLDLKVCHGEADVNTETGECEVVIKCPGTPGSGQGRYLAGGELFFDVAHAGDAVTGIAIVDVDNIMGYGAHTVLKTYHDEEVPLANQGWHVPPKFGHIEVETLGFYGFLPAGLYLEIYGKKAAGNYSGKMFLNLFWGKSE